MPKILQLSQVADGESRVSFLSLRGVCKSFGANGAKHVVLKNIDLETHKGEFLAILGFSGSGKTTLISLLAGLLNADAGAVELKGKPILGPGPDRGVVFQNYSLLPWLSVEQNVGLAVDAVFGNWSRAERRDHVAKFVEMVSLSHARTKLPRELSGGMRQRVSLARALAMDPEVLLMDEPLGALDALNRGVLQEEIQRIWGASQKTVVLITNDIDEAILLADRVITLTPGPGATLGAEFRIDLPRPRMRVELQSNANFKRLRAEITRYMTDLSSTSWKSQRIERSPPDEGLAA